MLYSDVIMHPLQYVKDLAGDADIDSLTKIAIIVIAFFTLKNEIDKW